MTVSETFRILSFVSRELSARSAQFVFNESNPARFLGVLAESPPAVTLIHPELGVAGRHPFQVSRRHVMVLGSQYLYLANTWLVTII